MCNRFVEIDCCDDCPFFDHIYYDFLHTCIKLDRVIPESSTVRKDRFDGNDYEFHNIPDDCPLRKVDDEPKT